MTVNTSDPRGLQFAQQYGVQVTPTLILVSHGHEVARLNLNSGVALNNPSAIQAWTDQF
jgi:hypothetical protein